VYGLPGWNAGRGSDETDYLKRQIGRIFNEWSDLSNVHERSGVFPPVNLTETRDHYILRAELPGVTPADLDIQTAGNSLSISGERKIAVEEASARYHRRERDAGRFSRAIALPGDIEADKITAKMSDGILEIVVPKAEKAKPRQIAVL
jgi:HSP20 family protein